MVWAAERKLEEDPEAALLIIQKALQQQPNNPEAQSLLPTAEEKFVKHVYRRRRSRRVQCRSCTFRRPI